MGSQRLREHRHTTEVLRGVECSEGDQRHIEGVLSAICGNTTQARLSLRQSERARDLLEEFQISSGFV